MVESAMLQPGFRGVCVREVQKSLKESSKRLIEDKIQGFGLGHLFDVQNELIKTPGGGLIVFQGMQDHTAESIKSLEGFNVAWVEEAQSLSQRSLTLLRPTIRASGSELWFSWNPRRKQDAVEQLLRSSTPPTGSKVIRANWSDNPWFPPELEQERRDDQRDRSDQYDHTWEGDYAKVTEGAYFAAGLTLAKQQGRISNVAADPLMTIRAVWDIGGTGRKADACAIWIVQFIGREIRVLDWYEAQGQPLAAHVNWLRSRGYDKALCVLPHDGATYDKVYSVSYESALREAGFAAVVIPNQGPGAAHMRIEAVRRLLPRIWFNADTTEGGRALLGAYHEKKSPISGVGLGPNHDDASHSADAFGLACVVYEEPRQKREETRQRPRATANSWMGS
jgi:phage terminase large subunit